MKILKIALVLILVALSIVGGWLLFVSFFSEDSEVSRPSSLFPEWLTGNETPTSINQTEPTQGIDNIVLPPESPLHLLSKEPVAGFVITERGDNNMVRFVEKATGNIFEKNIQTPDIVRLSNTTIPGIVKASFTKSGSRVALQYLNDNHTISTYLAEVPETLLSTSTDQGEMSGVFLPENVVAITPHPSSENFFYIANESSGVRGFIISSSVPGQHVFSSPIKEWSARFTSTDKVVLTTKPSSSSYGFMYAFNPATRGMNRLLGYIPGLTGLVRESGGVVAYSKSSDRGVSLNLFNLSTETSTLLPVATLPEKCSWSRVNEARLFCGVPRTLEVAEYPDSWYQGEISFRDDLWVIDTTEGSASMLTDFKEYAEGVTIDLIEPALSESDDYLVFKNKRDGSLWSFDLPEEFE